MNAYGNISEVGSGEGKNSCHVSHPVDSWRRASMPRTFLIVEDSTEGQYLLSRTLKRKFPDAAISTCEDADEALAIANRHVPNAVIVHRAADADGVAITRQLREQHPALVIIMVSGRDQSREAQAAGATRFLSYEEWLRIGTIVADELKSAD